MSCHSFTEDELRFLSGEVYHYLKGAALEVADRSDFVTFLCLQSQSWDVFLSKLEENSIFLSLKLSSTIFSRVTGIKNEKEANKVQQESDGFYGGRAKMKSDKESEDTKITDRSSVSLTTWLEAQKESKKKELKRKKKKMIKEVKSIEEKAEKDLNLMLAGLSIFTIFYGVAQSHILECKNRWYYGLTITLSLISMVSFLGMLGRKVYQFDTELKKIHERHRVIKSELPQLDPDINLETFMDESSVPCLFYSDHRADFPPLLHSSSPPVSSFAQFIMEPLEVESFWWRYWIGAASIGFFVLSYAISLIIVVASCGPT